MQSRPRYISFWLHIYFVWKSVFDHLLQRPLNTALTILTIAVSLTMPTVGYLLWKNASTVANQFSPQTEIIVYLHKKVDENTADKIVEAIRQEQGVESLTYISRQQSLNDFRQWSGFSEELDILDDNPLPAVVILKLEKSHSSEKKTS